MNAHDPTGLYVEVIITSGNNSGNSYGHAAININGTLYGTGRYGEQWGPAGTRGESIVGRENFDRYIQRAQTSGRSAVGYALDLTGEQERALQDYFDNLIRSGRPAGPGRFRLPKDYNFLTNNCSSTAANALESVLPWYADLIIDGNTPFELGQTVNMVPGLVDHQNDYPGVPR